MSIRIQQLYKSQMHKLDKLPDTRRRLARYERENRMGAKAAGVLLDAVARNVVNRDNGDLTAWEHGK